MNARGVGNFEINFNVSLSDGTLLTDKKYRNLLNTFKYWIIASVHPDNTRGRGLSYADATAKNIIVKVLYLIDYLLLNDKYLHISNYGLQVLTGDNLVQIADRQSEDKFAAEHIYAWTETLSEFLLDKIANNKEALLYEVNKAKIDFTVISDNQADLNELKIPVDLIPLARCWLWNNGFYRKSYLNDEYEYVVNTSPLSELFYGNITLRGAFTTKASPTILNLGESSSRTREYARVPVSNDDDDTLSPTGLKEYRTAMKSLLLLRDDTFSDENLSLPSDEAISAYLNYIPDNVVSKRFVSLPSKVVFSAVRNAIEFHLQYANPLIVSLRNLVDALSKKRIALRENVRSSTVKILSPKEFSFLLHPEIRAIGVEKWTVSKEKNRFDAIRKNKGLAELIRVYYGCVQIVVGALMARRQKELAELSAQGCLDESKRFLLFRKGKSTRLLEGMNAMTARPIDEIAVEMIESLIEFHKIYLEFNLIKELGHLFDSVSQQDPCKLISVTRQKWLFAKNLDYFCDYFETPLRDGKRFYIRNHQLRRFFALAFFWGNGFGGLDTLRWFLGHTDPEHLYRYITENTPGEVLRHAKAQFMTETIDEHTELRELIYKQFGTLDFTVLNTDELEGYLDDLLCNDKIDLEPEFIEDDRGITYRMLVVIREKLNDR